MFQPELFDDLQRERKPKHFEIPHLPGQFLRFRVAYQDAVFVLLSLILVVLAGFCIGVERGKRLGPQPAVISTVGLAAARESHPALPRSAPEAQAIESSKTLPVIPAEARPAPVAPASAPASDGSGFAVQLATYVGPESAQQEARRLAAEGIMAQVLKQGRYYELRASGYRSRSEAKHALTRLRKTYPDAFMKRVSNDSHN